MEKEYTSKSMEQILSRELEIPDVVGQRMQDTYKQLGIEKIVSVHRKKRKSAWKIIAAVAVLTVGVSTTIFAANKLLSARLVLGEKEGEAAYDIQIDTSMEAHEIVVNPSYLPEGYVYQEDGAHGGKYWNAEKNDGITITGFNAAELYRMERTGNNLLSGYKDADFIKTVELNGQKADLFVEEEIYADSADTMKNLYLFNEEYGYIVWICNNGLMDSEEMVKIAEGMEVTVLDSVVAYVTEEEINRELEENARAQAQFDAQAAQGIPKGNIYGIGEEAPLYPEGGNLVLDEYHYDIRFTVKSVEVRDTISFDEFPMENFIEYEEAAAWMNEDGSLKPYVRERRDQNGEAVRETVTPKYVVVEMNVRNADEVRKEQASAIQIVPRVKDLIREEDGTCRMSDTSYVSASKGYSLSTGAGFPIYTDQRNDTEGKKRVFIRLLEPGESLDYTLIYVVDEDRLDSMAFQNDNGTPFAEKCSYTVAGSNLTK